MEEPDQNSDPAIATRPSQGVAAALSWMVFTQIVGQLAWIGSLVILGGLLPPSAFGSVAGGMVIVSIAVLLISAGTYGKIVTTRVLSVTQIRRAVLLNFGAAATLTTLVAAFASPLAQAFARGTPPAVLQVLMGSVLANAMTIAPMALLVKHMQMKRFAVVSIIATSCASAGSVLTALAGAGVWALVSRQLAYQVLLAAGGWWAVRPLFKHHTGRTIQVNAADDDHVVPKQGRSGWFFILALIEFVAFNIDFVVVGRLTSPTELGLYSLAFALAFAPLRQVAWQVGRVFFSAAAAEDDPERVRANMLKGMRMASLLFFPLLPPCIVLAPVVVPLVLGDRWREMVPPFQILLVVGIGHALLNIMGEFLLGTGHVAFRVRLSALWATATVILMWLLVPTYGIEGAAVSHALIFLPLLGMYVVGCGNRLGVRLMRFGKALWPMVRISSLEAAITAAVWVTLESLGFASNAQAAIAAAVGLGLAILLLTKNQDSPLAEAKELAAARSGRRRN